MSTDFLRRGLTTSHPVRRPKSRVSVLSERIVERYAFTRAVRLRRKAMIRRLLIALLVIVGGVVLAVTLF